MEIWCLNEELALSRWLVEKANMEQISKYLNRICESHWSCIKRAVSQANTRHANLWPQGRGKERKETKSSATASSLWSTGSEYHLEKRQCHPCHDSSVLPYNCAAGTTNRVFQSLMWSFNCAGMICQSLWPGIASYLLELYHVLDRCQQAYPC